MTRGEDTRSMVEKGEIQLLQRPQSTATLDLTPGKKHAPHLGATHGSNKLLLHQQSAREVAKEGNLKKWGESKGEDSSFGDSTEDGDGSELNIMGSTGAGDDASFKRNFPHLESFEENEETAAKSKFSRLEKSDPLKVKKIYPKHGAAHTVLTKPDSYGEYG